MIYVPLDVFIVIVLVNLWLYLRLIYCFARRTSIRTITDLHRPSPSQRTAAPYLVVIADERHRR